MAYLNDALKKKIPFFGQGNQQVILLHSNDHFHVANNVVNGHGARSSSTHGMFSKPVIFRLSLVLLNTTLLIWLTDIKELIELKTRIVLL